MKKGLLFLNGTPPSKLLFSQIDLNFDKFCTDGAFNYLKKYCLPDFIVGDFDSIKLSKNSIPESIKILKFPAEKDFTDGFLAVKIMIEQDFDVIDIYGALGGRPDHEMSNYLLLSLASKAGITARFVGEKFDIHLAKTKFNATTKIGKIVSLVPFSDKVHILYTKGLKYPIENLVMQKYEDIDKANYIMGVSNCAESENIEYAIQDGLALVYLEK